MLNRLRKFLQTGSESPSTYHPEQDPLVQQAQKTLISSRTERTLLRGTLDKQEATGFLLGDAVLGRQGNDRRRHESDS